MHKPWLITIAENAAKCADTLQHLSSHGINPVTFYGFSAATSALITMNTFEIDNPGTGYRITGKTCCLALSHIALWKSLLFQPEDAHTIMEDDVRMVGEWRDRYNSALRDLPDDWDIFMPGSCCIQGRPIVKVGEWLYRVGFANCTHCYAVRKKALKILIANCARFDAPLDIAMAVNAFPHLRVYAVIPRVVEQFDTEIPP